MFIFSIYAPLVELGYHSKLAKQSDLFAIPKIIYTMQHCVVYIIFGYTKYR